MYEYAAIMSKETRTVN